MVGKKYLSRQWNGHVRDRTGPLSQMHRMLSERDNQLHHVPSLSLRMLLSRRDRHVKELIDGSVNAPAASTILVSGLLT